MASFWGATPAYLDEEFDAPDVVAEHELCQAIVAGRWGLHPDAWGNHDPLPLRWLLRKRPWPGEEQERVYHPPRYYPPVVEPKPRRKPGPKPKPRHVWPGWHPHSDAPAEGTLQLTCDVCERRLPDVLVGYYGDRPVKVAVIRALGHTRGWTCIAGTDRCPQCSQAAAPESVGDGTGGNQGNEQHA
jgi:hypothetical protein